MSVSIKRGTQIAYVPIHANGSLTHPDVEYGFVTSIVGDIAFCRYWSRHGGLRTTAESQATPIHLLLPVNTVEQGVVDELLSQIDDHPFEYHGEF